MSLWTRWIRRRSDDDFAAELESHLALETERLVRSGMSAEEARFAARRAFGNMTAPREHFHDARPGAALESVAQDVRYGLRAMRRAPGFTAVAVASFAIGIGANTTMFGAVDALLFRTPAHVRDADRIHRVYFEMPGSRGPLTNHGYRTYEALRDNVRGFDAVGAFSARPISSGRGADARSIDAVLVTPSVLTMLGVRPALGRLFTADEERDEGDHVAVLGYDAWRDRFGGDSTALGRTIDVAGTPHVIVGVAPRGFTGLDVNRVDLWLPIGVANRIMRPGVVGRRAGGYWLEIVARRRADASEAQLVTEVTQAYRDEWRGERRYETTFGKANAVLGPIVAARGRAASPDAKVSLWVAAVSMLVLLIAAANVANLLLLRGLARSREVALRLSLGASRWRVARQWLVEGSLLAIAGAACAIVIARWTATAMRTFLVPDAPAESVLAPRMLAFTAVVALGAGLLASIVPAFVTARRNFAPLLGTGRAGGLQRLAWQRALVGGQVALALLLLVGAGLFITSLRNVHAIDLAVDVEHVLYVNIDFGRTGKMRADPDARASANATYTAILDRVRQVSGVSNAAVTFGSPLGGGSAMGLRRRGGPEPAGAVPFWRAVGAGYFETMGTPLVHGRLFTPADHVFRAHVAIVDESTAKKYGLDRDGLDPCVYLGSEQECTEIVGVVKNTVLWEMTGDKGSIIYTPFESWGEEAVNMLAVRTTGDPAPMIPAIRQAVLAASPDLPWADIRPLSEWLAPQLRPWRLGASMFTAFGVLALCLAAVGVYGLLSYVVTQRTQEIGIRKALGAPDAGVVRMVLRGALGMTLAGVAAGVVIALAGGRFLASQLYGVSPRDPFVIVVCAVSLVVVAIVACLAPARRATRVDPMVALKIE
jgi:predicted permease